jgi:anti-sigma regulatory factor (Ser/Thr protein kinase)
VTAIVTRAAADPAPAGPDAPAAGAPGRAARPRPRDRQPRHGDRSDSLEFGAYPGAVPSARLHARAVLAEWGLAELSGDTESVITELVENAVQATSRAGLAAPVRLTLIAGLRTVLAVVRDAVADPPAPRHHADGLGPWAGDDEADPDQHGNGLIIVTALSSRWDWKPTPDGGKAVRALIRGQRRA